MKNKKATAVASTAALAMAAAVQAAPAVPTSSSGQNGDAATVMSSLIAEAKPLPVPPPLPPSHPHLPLVVPVGMGATIPTMLGGEEVIHLALPSHHREHGPLHSHAHGETIVVPLNDLPGVEMNETLVGVPIRKLGHRNRVQFRSGSPTSRSPDSKGIIWRKPDGSFGTTSKGHLANFGQAGGSPPSSPPRLQPQTSTSSTVVAVVMPEHQTTEAEGDYENGDIELAKRSHLTALEPEPEPHDKKTLQYFGQPHSKGEHEHVDGDENPNDNDNDKRGDLFRRRASAPASPVGAAAASLARRSLVADKADENLAVARRSLYRLSLGQESPRRYEFVAVDKGHDNDNDDYDYEDAFFDEDDFDDDAVSIRSPLTAHGVIFDVPTEVHHQHQHQHHQPRQHHHHHQQARDLFETHVRPFLGRRGLTDEVQAPPAKRDYHPHGPHYHNGGNYSPNSIDSHGGMGRSRGIYKRGVDPNEPREHNAFAEDEGEDELERRSHKSGSNGGRRWGGWRHHGKRSIIETRAVGEYGPAELRDSSPMPVEKRSVGLDMGKRRNMDRITDMNSVREMQLRDVAGVAPLTEANLDLLRRSAESESEPAHQLEKRWRFGSRHSDGCSTHDRNCHKKADSDYYSRRDEPDPDELNGPLKRRNVEPEVYPGGGNNKQHHARKEETATKPEGEEEEEGDPVEKRSVTCNAQGGGRCFASDGATQTNGKREAAEASGIEMEKRAMAAPDYLVTKRPLGGARLQKRTVAGTPPFSSGKCGLGCSRRQRSQFEVNAMPMVHKRGLSGELPLQKRSPTRMQTSQASKYRAKKLGAEKQAGGSNLATMSMTKKGGFKTETTKPKPNPKRKPKRKPKVEAEAKPVTKPTTKPKGKPEGLPKGNPAEAGMETAL